MQFGQLKRREFITLLGGAAAARPVAARAQQGERVRRIGVLETSEDDPHAKAQTAAFRDRLRQLGWVDGRNVRIDVHWTRGSVAETRKHAAELAALAPDVILTTGANAGAMLQASNIID
jgi:putative ABC transport system substrate-binding protein